MDKTTELRGVALAVEVGAVSFQSTAEALRSGANETDRLKAMQNGMNGDGLERSPSMADTFAETLAANVDNHGLDDAAFREFIRNSLSAVLPPQSPSKRRF